MEELAEIKSKNISDLGELKEPSIPAKKRVEKQDSSEIDLSNVDLSIPQSSEDSFFKQLISNRGGVYINEKWTNTFQLQGRIVDVSASKVAVECIIDKEAKVFQVREFPRDLFANIQSLLNGVPIFLKISSKAGSTRIDVYNGKGIVNEELFHIKDEWDKLKDSGLDEPYKP